MRIALISYEFSALGGIGTYIRNVADVLSEAGHEIEVFCSSQLITPDRPPYFLHGVECDARADFQANVVSVFSERHALAPFDVAELPEYGAEGSGILCAFPDLPSVIRLHTPSYMLSELWDRHVTTATKLRFMLGALRRGRSPFPFPWNQPDSSGERDAALKADLVVGPCQSILDLVGARWGIPEEKRMVVPNVFNPPSALLTLDPNRHTKTVLYLGRLEPRKGVIDLAKAIPRVCAADPDVRFLILGKDGPFPFSTESTKAHMLRHIGRWRDRVEFIDGVTYAEVPAQIARADIAVLPSLYESFGYTCLEAMSAGCAVIGSSAGGMAEMIEDGVSGLLVAPEQPKDIARKILSLLEDPDRRAAMGHAARKRVLDRFTAEAVLPAHIASYERAQRLNAERRKS